MYDLLIVKRLQALQQRAGITADQILGKALAVSLFKNLIQV